MLRNPVVCASEQTIHVALKKIFFNTKQINSKSWSILIVPLGK